MAKERGLGTEDHSGYDVLVGVPGEFVTFAPKTMIWIVLPLIAIPVARGSLNNDSPETTGSACAFGSCWSGTYKLTIPGQQVATGTWAGVLGASLAFAASGAVDPSKEVISQERRCSICGFDKCRKIKPAPVMPTGAAPDMRPVK